MTTRVDTTSLLKTGPRLQVALDASIEAYPAGRPGRNRETIVPLRRLRLRYPLVPVLVGVLLLLQVFSPAPPILYVLCVLSGVSAVAYYWARNLRDGLSLKRDRRYGWAQVGDVIEERFSLINEAHVSALWAEIRDHSTLPGYTGNRVASVEQGSVTRWTTEGFCRRRGVFTLGPLSVHSADPLGLFSVSVEYPYQDSFTVYPTISALPEIELPRGVTGGKSRTHRRARQLTTDVASVRPYLPGDAVTRIHWRSTARHEDLHVKEFDLKPSGDLWLILDLESAAQLGEGDQSTEEYAIILAASLAYRALQENRAVGLVAFDTRRTIVRVAKGQAQLWPLLRTLADISADGEWPLARVLEEVAPILGRGMTAAVVTASPDPAWLGGLLLLKRYGISSTAILLDRQSFGGQGNARVTAGLLAEYGVPSHIVTRDYRFDPLIPRKRQRPILKVLATGRVIVIPPEEATRREMAGIL